MQFVFSFNDVYTAACLAFSVPIATIFVPSGFDCQSVSYHELVSQHVTILLISFIPRECVPQLRNRIFELFSKCGKDQWDCKIVRSKQAVNVTYRGICHKICETLQGTLHYRVLWLAEGSWGWVSRASQAIMLPDLIPEYLILCSRLFFLWRADSVWDPISKMAYCYTTCAVLVSCPPRARLPVRNGLVNEVEFLGLIHQNGGRPMRLRDR